MNSETLIYVWLCDNYNMTLYLIIILLLKVVKGHSCLECHHHRGNRKKVLKKFLLYNN